MFVCLFSLVSLSISYYHENRMSHHQVGCCNTFLFVRRCVCIFEPGFCREVDRRGYQVPPLGPWKRECAPLLFIFFIFPSHCLLLRWWWYRTSVSWWRTSSRRGAYPFLSLWDAVDKTLPPTHTTQSRFYPLPAFSTSSLFLFFFILIFLLPSVVFTLTCLFVFLLSPPLFD